MEDYRARIADQLLSESLEALGAVLVQGTKWCGKTTTSVHHAKSVLYMDDPTQKEQNLSLAYRFAAYCTLLAAKSIG